MTTIKNFEELEVWQRLIEMADKRYGLCMNDFLKKDFSLQDQVKRAALSISNNIAEGFEYNNNPDFVKFLRYQKTWRSNWWLYVIPENKTNKNPINNS